VHDVAAISGRKEIFSVSRISHRVWGGDDVAPVGDERHVGNRRQNAAAQSSAVVNRIVAGESESLQRRGRQEGPLKTRSARH
jgi:hypothetical protein